LGLSSHLVARYRLHIGGNTTAESMTRGINMIMKKTLRIGVTAFGLAAIAAGAPASAADIYQQDIAPSLKDRPALMPMWQGLYIGAHVGGAWGDMSTTNLNEYPDAATRTKQTPDGVFGGAQLGYNFQRDRIVFGVEVDLGGMDLDGSKAPAGVPEAKANVRGGFYGDATGRLGIVADRALFYAKGGFAWYDGAANFTDPTHASAVASTDTFAGWAAGGGIEYMLRPNWSLKAEYMHFDFGAERAVTVKENTNYHFKHDLTADTLKLGLNYHVYRDYVEPLK
jgi:outer membrane immunogenic protein